MAKIAFPVLDHTPVSRLEWYGRLWSHEAWPHGNPTGWWTRIAISWWEKYNIIFLGTVQGPWLMVIIVITHPECGGHRERTLGD